MAVHADSRPLATIAALYIISAVAYARLPPATVDRAFIAFLLPTAAGTIYVLMRLLAAHDHVRRGNGTFTRTYDAIVFRIVLFIGALHGTSSSGCSGAVSSSRTGPLVPRLAPFLLGAGLMTIGNLLPRVRPNVAIGIRTSRTLHDRDAWLRANRTAGYVDGGARVRYRRRRVARSRRVRAIAAVVGGIGMSRGGRARGVDVEGYACRNEAAR